MRIGKPLAEVDELVTLLYRGPLEATPWLGFLEALSRRMRCASAAITLRLSRQGTPPLIIWGPPPVIDEREARRIHAVHAELGDLDPLRNALTKAGDIFRLSEVISPEDLRGNRFYREILQPYGIEYQLGMYISEPGGWEGNVGLTNGPDEEDFTDDDKAVLLALRPHLEQSLALFSRIRRDETELQVMIDTLDRLTLCTFILDGAGRILRTNSAGRALIKSSTALRAADDRLVLASKTGNAQLQQLVGKAVAARRDGGSFAEGLRVEADIDRHLGVLVRTIETPSRYSNEAGPAAVVYVSGLDNNRPLERLVSQIFDLTPSEAHLAALLATGLSLAEAAAKLELTENTVRSYCKTILSKTGVSRQADLVRLILRSVAVLG
ncbi:LuxR family transcriptional regulator [Sphingopyxis sp. H038]|uniref:helix-turn-helix transcriptional regulator n=1 Tax=unclassified Sphingopyxis TaxID=2614943 RepID=UPI0007316EFE|nr:MULTISPECIES: helix-turn-helix transcriptional regulator [unclassified Sphingopyxis]KTE04254.1 LuxR family transcriptional regulator [Sphingopyxis sp. H012]KTE10905.1 LuxR family transcriptional regulator [Sphingopyxis sp. H093]KTE13544.1 LuxR family transcriptional regulator [Sphingopyxis sp. H053]KTE25595.1 LuxR family transcriptional regulator [Sphingopyxis sp. H080]KTE36743.1 LuxR family transcriptional regulator [Sphingopyxis sp. H038]